LLTKGPKPRRNMGTMKNLFRNQKTRRIIEVDMMPSC
jgi:hypothetical protein